MKTRLNGPLWKLLLATCLIAGGVALLWPRAEIAVCTAVGPGIPGRYKHAASACELENGDILLVYYSGSGEYGRDTAIYGTRLDRTKNRWSRSRIIADEPHKAEGNPALWRAPDGRLWMFYPVRQGDSWATARLAAKASDDDGATWADASPPTDEAGFMTRARPITLPDGSCLLPVDFNPSTDPEFVSEQSGSLFFRSDRDLQQWEATEIIHSRLGNHQPAVALEGDDDGRLVAYCRRGGDYYGREDGMLVRSQSLDGGATWSGGAETDFPNPNSPADFVQLQSGHLLLAYNDSSFERRPLAVALSTDGDRSYPHRRDIIDGDLSYSYPCVLQVADGTIYLFFTAGSRSHIKYARFTEQDITGE